MSDSKSDVLPMMIVLAREDVVKAKERLAYLLKLQKGQQDIVKAEERLANLLKLQKVTTSTTTTSTTATSTAKGRLYEGGTRLIADYTDEKWIARHRCMYDKLDRDHNGFVTLDEFVYKASVEICGAIGASKEQTMRHTAAVTNFFTGAGMKFGVEQLWPEYIKGWEILSEQELDKWAKGEKTLIREWGEALFDIIDKDGNNAISVAEWETYQRAAQVCEKPEDAKHTFDVCDRNGDGKIEIDEMTRQHVGFWYTADPASDGLYGPGVP